MFINESRSSSISLEIIKRNRLNAISLLKSASERNLDHLVETCMMAWAQVGRYFAPIPKPAQ
jgi:serine/threonine-protein kinase ATR